MFKNYNQYFELLDEKANNGQIPVWQVDGENYYNKLGATLQAQKLNSYVQFNFFQGRMDNVDWSVTTDTVNVYLQRLEQIRDSYDVVRLMYSGGADSKLILDTAFDNDIFLDYIVIFRGGPLEDSLSDVEIARAQQHIKPYLEKFPKTKFVLLPIDFSEFNDYYSLDIEQWTKISGVYDYCDRPQLQSWQYLGGKYSDFFWEPYLKGLTHCDLTGKEPPNISMINGELVWFFYDVNVDHHLSPFCEWFYVSPDFPQAQRYQVHQTKRFLEQNNLVSTVQMSPKQIVDCKIATGKPINGDDSYLLDSYLKGIHKGVLALWECKQNNQLSIVDSMMRRAAFFQNQFDKENLSVNFPKINLVGCISDLYSLQTPGKVFYSGDPDAQQIFQYSRNTVESKEFNNLMKDPLDYVNSLWKVYGIEK